MQIKAISRAEIPAKKEAMNPTIIEEAEAEEGAEAPTIRRRAEVVSRICLPPKQGPVGGCLSPHWRVWEREGACAWTVEVLRSGYRLPFKLMPPLSLTPMDLAPSIRQSGMLPLLKRGRWKS